MPILEIEIVLRPNDLLLSDLAARLAEAAAAVFQGPKGSTWVKLRALQQTEYAENGGGPQDAYPVFVRVLKARLPRGVDLETEISHLTEALAQICERPAENVHVIYEPAGSGRVAFGGKPVR